MKIRFMMLALVLALLLQTNAFAGRWITTTLEYDGKVQEYSAEEIIIKVNGSVIEDTASMPVILEGRTLVGARSVFESLGCTVSWDEANRRVDVTRGAVSVSIVIGKQEGVRNGAVFVMDVPPRIINDYTMIPLRAVAEALSLEVGWNSETRTVEINEGITEVVEDSVIIGEEGVSTQGAEPVIPDKNPDTITMLWDQISTVDGNYGEGKRDAIEGLNVISPTWFAIANSNGDMLDKGSVEYAQWARSQGYELWALVTNSFDATITHNVLSDPAKRKKVIDALSGYADTYMLQGINIDFENVGKNDGEYYVTFIREATEAFHNKGLVVSVDMYIPSSWTEHYNMKAVGEIVDYVVIMAYDEHYSSSPVSGSVSSIEWVDKAIKEVCNRVNPQKVIIGNPFYTRLWTTREGKVSSVSMKMDEAYEMLLEKGALMLWLDSCGQYYGSWTEVEDGVTVTKEIWLEDATSTEERMKLAKSYGVKGVSFWKRGHENTEVWDIINSYF